MGYELKAVGLNQRAAACNGVPVVRSIIFSAFLSGGLAAIAGSIEVLAIQKKLMEGISGDCGYTAVLIALVAFNRPRQYHHRRGGRSDPGQRAAALV